jgi:hypothetical protein
VLAGLLVNIRKTTILLPFDLDFDQQAALDMICRGSISHIFIGGLGQTFDALRLNARPEWYRPLLAIQRTRVYEVIGCKL